MIGRTVPGDFPVIFYLQHRCQRHFLQYTIGSVPLCTRKNNLTVPLRFRGLVLDSRKESKDLSDLAKSLA